MYILAMSKAGGTIGMLLWIIVLFGFMYFFMARPQKQEQKRKEAMRADLAIGDTVLTTSGFYGTVIDINDDTVWADYESQLYETYQLDKYLEMRATYWYGEA